MSIVEERIAPKKKRKSKGKLKKRLRSASQQFFDGDDSAFEQWQAHVRTRKQPRALGKLIRSDTSPYLWGVETIDLGSQASSVCDALWKLELGNVQNGSMAGLPAAAEDWLQAATGPLTFDWALLSVAWAAALPKLATTFEASNWRALLDQLLSLAQDSAAAGYQPDSLACHLFAVELPLTLAHQVPECAPAKALLASGADALADGLLERHDGAGFPGAADVAHLRAWLATWTRSLQLTLAARHKVGKKPLEQFDWLVRHALRLTRTDRSQVFWPSRLQPRSDVEALFNCALKITDDPEDKSLCALIVKGEEVRDSRLPLQPGYESEWSHFAVLQPDWSPKEPRLAIDFSSPQVRAELSVRGNIISQGIWDTKVVVDSTALSPTSEWESICWFDDDDADYLEIECSLQGNWKLQRSFLFARQDYFLFVGDTLIGESSGDIQIEQTIPLAENVACPESPETVERFIVAGNRRALVVPPALSEWRSERRLGTLDFADRRLRQRTCLTGSAAYLPLFIDVHPRRHRKQVTWRQLTVGRDLDAVARDEAVGYRVHVGPEQWLFYRSMNRAVRSVLGQNVLCDFLCGRFLHDGDVDPILEIEDD